MPILGAPVIAPVTDASLISPILPPGWTSKQSKSTGKAFFYHVGTKATAWTVGEIPGYVAVAAVAAFAVAVAAATPPADSDSALPAGWARRSSSSGKVFFYNAATKVTSWMRPVA